MLNDLRVGLQFSRNNFKKGGGTDEQESIELSSLAEKQQSSTQSPAMPTFASGSNYFLRSSDTTDDVRAPLEVAIDSPIDEDLEFPEGGLQAYLVVFGSFMGLIPTFGMINSVGAVQAYISAHQLANASTTTVAWIFSIYLFVSLFCNIFSGAFFDRNGARPPLVIGTVFFCGGLFATANCKTSYQFILGFGIATGFGTGMLTSPLVGVVSHYFKRKRATACSIATTGGSIGGIVFPVMLRKLYADLGFAWAMRILSFVCMFCLILSIVFAKGRLNVEKSQKLPFGEVLRQYFKEMFDFRSLLELKFMSCAFGITFAECSLLASSVYFTSYALARGFSKETSYLLVTVTNATGILGRYIPGYIADKWMGRFNVAMITVMITAILNLVMWLPFGSHLKVLYAYSSLYGFFSGSILSLSPVCCGQISRTEEFGRRYSTAYLIVSLLMLAAIQIGGVIVGDGSIHNYNNFIIYTSMIMIAGAICYYISFVSAVGLKLCKF